ncbi:hypothetical protein D3C72_2364280 [compost metagenome]
MLAQGADFPLRQILRPVFPRRLQGRHLARYRYQRQGELVGHGQGQGIEPDGALLLVFRDAGEEEAIRHVDIVDEAAQQF